MVVHSCLSTVINNKTKQNKTEKDVIFLNQGPVEVCVYMYLNCKRGLNFASLKRSNYVINYLNLTENKCLVENPNTKIS